MLTLTPLPQELAICRLAPTDPIPDWATGDFVSITRTRDELSIVCNEPPEDVRAECGWRSLRVKGPMSFDMIGVIAGIAARLAMADLTIFVISTFDTDYILVRDLPRAIDALRKADYTVQE